MTSRRRISSSPLPLLASWVCALIACGDEPETAPGNPGADDSVAIVLRGEVVDINDELRKAHTIDISADAEPFPGFKTAEGRLYTLLKTRRSLALFMDERLRGRELIVKGRLFPGTQIVEVTFIQSVRNGIVNDVYYYCDICAIKALTPEACACCREPVRLVEEPVKQKGRER